MNDHFAQNCRAVVVGICAVLGAARPSLAADVDVGPAWRQLAATASPLPTVQAFAQANHIALSGIDVVARPPRAGDTVVMLVTLQERGLRTQWLARLSTEDLTPAESRRSAPPEKTIYTSTGRVLHFQSPLAALNVVYAGPFTSTGGPSRAEAAEMVAKPHRSVVSANYLSIGLDRYAATALRVSSRAQEAHATEADYFYIGSGGPLTPQQLERGRRYQRLAQPTEDEERLILSVSFALNEFLGAALDVSDFRNTVQAVMDKPSVWSLITSFGGGQFIQYDARQVKALSPTEYAFPLHLYELPVKLSYNGKLALRAQIVMTAAEPPLQACGGLVLVYAEHPLDRSKQLLIQVISSRPSERKGS